MAVINITGTYDTTAGTMNCLPNQVDVQKGQGVTINVKLALDQGAPSGSSIAFDSPALTWNPSPPPKATISQPGSTNTLTIQETNGNSGKDPVTYGFLVNYVYTPPPSTTASTAPIKGSSLDPTIVNEGTGQ